MRTVNIELDQQPKANVGIFWVVDSEVDLGLTNGGAFVLTEEEALTISRHVFNDQCLVTINGFALNWLFEKATNELVSTRGPATL